MQLLLVTTDDSVTPEHMQTILAGHDARFVVYHMRPGESEWTWNRVAEQLLRPMWANLFSTAALQASIAQFQKTRQ
jgi:hypothetical protein